MPLDPNIALSVQTPQPVSPMTSIGGLMQMRSQITENALRSAQTAQAQQETAKIQADAQQHQRDLADANTIQNAMQDPAKATRIATGDFSDVQGQIQPKSLQALTVWHNTDQEARLKNDQTQNQVASENLGKIEDTVNGLKHLAETDPQAAAASYPDAVNNLKSQKAFQYLPNLQIPQSISGDQQELDVFLAHIGALKAAQDKALETQKTQQGIATSASQQKQADSEAALNAAKQPGAQAESQIKKNQADAMQSLQQPGGLERMVAGGIDQTKYPAEYAHTLAQAQNALNLGLPVTAIQAVIKDGADRIGRLEAGVEAAKQKAPIQISIAAGSEAAKNKLSKLSPDAVDMAAEMYAKTGQLPSLGMGNPTVRRQILDRAAQLHPHVDLATNAAAYAANKQSLEGLQKNRDAVLAFENTAGKNLDLFLSQAGKVVDSGSPWINSPLRAVATGGLGSADLAAYNAARQVAINEIAKVTSNPGLSGQLSDTARKEVENFNPNNATLAQTYSVAKVLKQDMANRHESYDEQIGDITKRIGGAQTSGSASNSTPKAAPSGGQVQVTDPRGVVHTFLDQASADNFKRAAHIQ